MCVRIKRAGKKPTVDLAWLKVSDYAARLCRNVCVGDKMPIMRAGQT